MIKFLSSIIIKLVFNNNLITFLKYILFRNKKNSISNHFKANFPDECEIDLFLFQLGIRKTLPIMDWLYFEYIKFINKNNKIKKLLIFPTVFTPTLEKSDDEFIEFSENINKIFKGSDIEINIINPKQDNYFKNDDFISEHFITTLKYIGSKEYFNYLKEDFKIKVTSITDFNKFRPVDDKVLNIFIQIYKSWFIVNYLNENINLNESINISSIFWEWEVEKLGVIKYYSSKKNNIIFYPVLGKTQMLSKDKIISEIENNTICIFDNEKSTMGKAIRFKRFLKKYNLLLKNVLSQYIEFKIKDIKINGKKIWEIYKVKNTEETRNINVSRNFFLFIGLINKIKLVINNEKK